MSGTTVCVSKNCCQVPVFIGGRDSVITDTKGRINLRVLAEICMLTTNGKEAKTRDHRIGDSPAYQVSKASLSTCRAGTVPWNQRWTKTHWGRQQGRVSLNQLSTPEKNRAERYCESQHIPHCHVCRLFWATVSHTGTWCSPCSV